MVQRGEREARMMERLIDRTKGERMIPAPAVAVTKSADTRQYLNIIAPGKAFSQSKPFGLPDQCVLHPPAPISLSEVYAMAAFYEVTTSEITEGCRQLLQEGRVFAISP